MPDAQENFRRALHRNGMRRRHYYSRELWNKTRVEDSSRVEKAIHILRAIVYELQPISVSKLIRITTNLSKTIPASWDFIRENAGDFFLSIYKFLSEFKFQLVVGSTLVYIFCKFVAFAHRVMDAGPIVIIVTMLVLIFTVGLSDNVSGEGSMSAYSVFNRSFARMMGGVDAESLVAQHVGMPIVAGMVHERHRNDNDYGDSEDDDNDDVADGNEVNHHHVAGPSRKSSKKARRRNLDLRRDRQRQRHVAREIGFGGDENLADNERAAINLAIINNNED